MNDDSVAIYAEVIRIHILTDFLISLYSYGFIRAALTKSSKMCTQIY